jgi:phosphoglycolate phosphatase
MARLWLLDFDGTLVDSEQTIKSCYIKVGQELVPDRLDFIKNMLIGPTLEETSRMILTRDKIHLKEEFKSRFQAIYDEEMILETKQYPNVNSTLNQLHKQGDHISIVTNKRFHPTVKLINYYGWNQFFLWVACMDKYPSAIDKSDLINQKKIDIKKYDEIFLVGDTLTDGKAAQKTDIPFIRANYGYGMSQNWDGIAIFKSIKQFNEILKI